MNLKEWLKTLQEMHPVEMDLSLERVSIVAKRLNLNKPVCPVITVGGTNGKGSCVAGLEAIYMAAGYKVGVFTSPVLFRHNEYIRIQGIDASDEQFCNAYEKIDKARGEITLTPFEFNALAAFDIFQQSNLDVWLLEVGLGGRYDAVNVIDADVAIISSIGIDHIDWLGDTREKIAYEKAGIFRQNKAVVCGDFDPPLTLISCAHELNANLYCQNREFGFSKTHSDWTWWSEHNRFENLPLPQLIFQNMSTVLMAVELLLEKLPVSRQAIDTGLTTATLMGRIQVIPGDVTRIFDVSHNPAATELLAHWLQENPFKGKTRAVFSMLADKDIVGTIRAIKNYINEWHVSHLPVKRGATKEKLLSSFQEADVSDINFYETVNDAYQKARDLSQPEDCVIVFGSFHTVAKVIIES